MGCFQDTCSTVVSEVEIPGVGPGYAIDSRLDPDGGIECNLGEGGLRVRLSANPGNLIQRDGIGGLFAGLPNATLVEQMSAPNRVAVPFGADAAAPASTPLLLAYQNNTALEQLIIIEGTYRLDFDVVHPDKALPVSAADIVRTGALPATAASGGAGLAIQLTPFNMQGVFRIQRSVNGGGYSAVSRHTAKSSNSGVVYASKPNTNELKRDWQHFVLIETIAPGATYEYRGAFHFEGSDQTLNVIASPASDDAPLRGFSVAESKLLVIPIVVN